MRYRFVGPARSMGLEPGKVYNVRTAITIGRIVVRWQNGACPYDSVNAFTDNWERVK